MYNVECPNCGYTNKVEVEPSENNNFKELCQSCDKYFGIEVEWEPNFTTYKLEKEVCDLCKCKIDDYSMKNKRKNFPWPDEQYDNLCGDCFITENKKKMSKIETKQDI